jgi:replicative DNA helicase
MLNGALGALDYPKITEAMNLMYDLPILIDDTPSRTAREIRSACRQLQSEQGLDLVIIDYIQLMQGTLERKNATRNEEIADISRRLKTLAGELNVPIIVLAQLSRESEKRTDPRPKLSDLRDSGALEQDADIVGFLHRKNHREGGVTNFIVEKQRNGPTGTINLTLQREFVVFEDGGDDPPPEPVEKPRRVKPPVLRY